MFDDVRPITVTGLRELETRLAMLGNDVGVRTLRSSLRAAARPMIDRARSLVPYDSTDPDGYHLRDSIGLSTEPKRTRTQTVQFRLGVRRETARPGGDAARGGRFFEGALNKTRKSPIYDFLVEFNTPFLRPAFDQTHGRVLVLFRQILGKRIEAATRRIARQRANQGQ